MAKFNIQLTPKQQQTAVAAAIMLIVGGFGYYKYFWSPISQRIEEDTKQSEDFANKILSAKSQARNLEALEKQIEDLEVEARDAEKRLPRDRDLPTVFDTVAKLARRYHIDVASFTPGGAKPQTYFIEVPYQLAITGRYHDIGRFMAALSVEERIYNVRDVNYALTGDKRVDAHFTLLAYQYKG